MGIDPKPWSQSTHCTDSRSERIDPLLIPNGTFLSHTWKLCSTILLKYYRMDWRPLLWWSLHYIIYSNYYNWMLKLQTCNFWPPTPQKKRGSVSQYDLHSHSHIMCQHLFTWKACIQLEEMSPSCIVMNATTLTSNSVHCRLAFIDADINEWLLRIKISRSALLVSILNGLAGHYFTFLTRVDLQRENEVNTLLWSIAEVQWCFTLSLIRITWPWRVLSRLHYAPYQGWDSLLSPSHALCSSLPPSMAAPLRQPSPFQMPSLQGPSLSSSRHRIKAWEITLLCPYGASIGLGQRTLNCNSAIEEKKKVNWAHQSAQPDKLLVVVIFQMLLSPSHIYRDGRSLYGVGRHAILVQNVWSLDQESIDRPVYMTSICNDLNGIIKW